MLNREDLRELGGVIERAVRAVHNGGSQTFSMDECCELIDRLGVRMSLRLEDSHLERIVEGVVRSVFRQEAINTANLLKDVEVAVRVAIREMASQPDLAHAIKEAVRVAVREVYNDKAFCDAAKIEAETPIRTGSFPGVQFTPEVQVPFEKQPHMADAKDSPGWRPVPEWTSSLQEAKKKIADYLGSHDATQQAALDKFKRDQREALAHLKERAAADELMRQECMKDVPERIRPATPAEMEAVRREDENFYGCAPSVETIREIMERRIKEVSEAMLREVFAAGVPK